MNPASHARFRFDAAIDARGVVASPAVAIIEFDERSWPAGRLVSIESSGGAGAEEGVAERPGEVLLPAFVNAHTHLDLTHIGPCPYDPADGFDSWLGMILAERRHDDAGIRASVLSGVERCLAGGVVAVGDIAGVGRTEPVEELRASPLRGRSYVEFFGLGARQRQGADAMAALADALHASDRGVGLGLSPHAPYTAGPALYEAAASLAIERSLALCTHLAESAAERRFVAACEGQMCELLSALGVLDDAARADFASGARPVAHLARALSAAPWLLAHVCDADDEDIAALARAGASVAYCPRSSDYFAHHDELGPHRYRDMLAAGVNVCLGTDSIVNLPLDAPGVPPTLGVLDEMRYLARRDGADHLTLLAMGTVNGAAALGLDPEAFLLTPGDKAGFTAVRAAGGTLAAVMDSRARAELLAP